MRKLDNIFNRHTRACNVPFCTMDLRRCGPTSPFQHIAQKCACLLGLLFGGRAGEGGGLLGCIRHFTIDSQSFVHSFCGSPGPAVAKTEYHRIMDTSRKGGA